MTAAAALAAVFALLAQSSGDANRLGCIADGTGKSMAIVGCMKGALARFNQPNRPPEEVANSVMLGCQNEVRQLAASLTACSNNNPADSFPE
jgi:hypothetical protein